MNIRQRVLMFMCLMFLFTGAMFVITWYVSGLEKADALVINLAGRQRMLTQKISKEWLQLMSAQDAASRDKFSSQLAKSIEVFERTHRALMDGGQAPLTLNPSGEQEVLPRSSGDAAIKFMSAGEIAREFLSAVRAGISDSKASGDKEAAIEAKLLGALNAAVEALQAQSEDKISMMLQAQGLCVLLSLASLLGSIFMMQKGLFRPLSNLLNYSTAVAAGNLRAHPEGEYMQELLTLKNSVESMVGNLHRVMEEVSEHAKATELRAGETALALEEAKRQEAESQRLLNTINTVSIEAAKLVDTLSSASEKLTSEVTQVTGGAERQRDRLRQAVYSMNEMNSALLGMAHNADTVADEAMAAKSSAEGGVTVVKAMLGATSRVRDEVTVLRESMSQLGKQVEGISVVMQIISDIADQTNLLALNAAIEAARAGEAGRGFAVVADEVRKLAEKTMQATSQVGQAVQAIQKDTQSSIAGVDRAANQAEEASSLALTSESSLDEILKVSKRTAEQVHSIATASNVQSASSSAIMNTLEEVDNISTETVLGMEVAFKAIADISSESKGLHLLINRMSITQSGSAKS